ncbi:MAG: hypothetical protein ACRDTC_18540 [Pseudonocardiaceae bacterium]
MTLTGGDLFVWLALRWVAYRRLTMLGGRYFDHGRPVDDHLAAALAELIGTGHLALRAAIPSGQQQVCVTHARQLRYIELNSNGVREGRHRGR